jgi:hypothetical protein
MFLSPHGLPLFGDADASAAEDGLMCVAGATLDLDDQ